MLWVSLFKIGFVTFLLWAAVAGVYYLWALNLDLRRIHEMSERSVVYDYQGKYYSRLAGENREVVPFDKVSNHFVNALISREDTRFYSHHGVDQQTIEARAYAVARAFHPLLVNTVVGFIGPEYLYDGKQITRAGLEDHFCGKLLGLPMGVDVCYTNHAEADQDDMDSLLTLLGVAGVTYVMGVPGADDVMLSYQSTSFHDALYLRAALSLKPAPEFEAWLDAIGRPGGIGPDRIPAAMAPGLIGIA